MVSHHDDPRSPYWGDPSQPVGQHGTQSQQGGHYVSRGGTVPPAAINYGNDGEGSREPSYESHDDQPDKQSDAPVGSQAGQCLVNKFQQFTVGLLDFAAQSNDKYLSLRNALLKLDPAPPPPSITNANANTHMTCGTKGRPTDSYDEDITGMPSSPQSPYLSPPRGEEDEEVYRYDETWPTSPVYPHGFPGGEENDNSLPFNQMKEEDLLAYACRNGFCRDHLTNQSAVDYIKSLVDSCPESIIKDSRPHPLPKRHFQSISIKAGPQVLLDAVADLQLKFKICTRGFALIEEKAKKMVPRLRSHVDHDEDREMRTKLIPSAEDAHDNETSQAPPLKRRGRPLGSTKKTFLQTNTNDTSHLPTPKKRGRPPGSANKRFLQANDNESSQLPSPKRRGRPPGSTKKRFLESEEIKPEKQSQVPPSKWFNA